MDIDQLPATSLISSIVLPDLGFGQIISLSLAVVALLISGFLSGSEIAFFSISPAQYEELDDEPKGNAIKGFLAAPERLLATILIANNFVNIAIVILCNFTLGPIFSSMNLVLGFILQTVILTFLLLLFGEILPKLYANNYPVKWCRFAIGPMSVALNLLSPLSRLLVRSSSIVNRVVSQKPQNISADDLSQALEITDVKADDEKKMLEEILHFGDKTAMEVMTPRVDMTCIDIRYDFDQVMKTIVSSGYSRIPVFDGNRDNIKGTLYSRDLLPYIGKATNGFKWQKLIRKSYFVPESRMIDDLLEDFRKLKIHLAIVVDEFGGTQGLVTLEDVLEEIVGDINDEYGDEQKSYRQLEDNTYIFEGKTVLDEFFNVTGLDEKEYSEATEGSETLAGMLLAIKGDFPKEKETIVYKGCRFLILDMAHHRIMSVKVKVVPENLQPLSHES